MPTRAVSDEIMKRANSLAEIFGEGGGVAMDEILGSVEIGEKRFLHLGKLSPHSLAAHDAEDFGFDGYFLFEVSDMPEDKGIKILGKTPTLDTAFRLLDIWQARS
jgi:hypothetical protein